MKVVVKNIGIKTIARFPDYTITKDGRVWSNWHQGIWLKPTIRNGRFFVSLSSKIQKNKACSIHRLVLETYVGPCPSGMECRHLNGNPQDNRLENLCWGTRLENQHDRVLHGTTNRGEQSGKAKLTPKKVERIRQMLKIGIHSQAEIARYFKVSYQTICAINQKRIWKNI